MSNSSRKNSDTTGNNSKATMIPEYGSHVPEDKDQYLVMTPYGPGLVLRTRKPKSRTSLRNGSCCSEVVTTMREIELTGWSNSNRSRENDTNINNNSEKDDANTGNSTNGRPIRPTMLYTSIDYPTMTPQVGSDVICPYGLGRGRVIEIRSCTTKTTLLDDTTTGTSHSCSPSTNTTANAATAILNKEVPTFVVVRLSSWRLAGRNTVLCHWDINTVRTVRHKHIYEMSIIEKIEYATALKQKAAEHFNKKEYNDAIVLYESAVNTVKYVQHNTDSTNAVRADLLIVMITCCNNSATCYMQLLQQQPPPNGETTTVSGGTKSEYYEKAYQHAQQALSLIDALEGKKGGRIHQELLHLDSCNDMRIFGEWKVKSLYIMAYIHYIKYDRIDDAIATIHKARDIIISMTKYNHTNQNHSKLESSKPEVITTITTTAHEEQLAKILVQLRKKERELLKLYHQCKERQKELLKIEKLRAQAMFATTSKSPTLSKNPSLTVSSPTTTTTTPNTNGDISSTITTNDDTTVPPPTAAATTQPPSNGDSYSNGRVKKSKGMKVSFDLTTKDTDNHQIDDDIANDNDDDDDDGTNKAYLDSHPTNTDLPWHHDPYVLTGLGVVVGTIGTLLLLSQLWMRPIPIER